MSALARRAHRDEDAAWAAWAEFDWQEYDGALDALYGTLNDVGGPA